MVQGILAILELLAKERGLVRGRRCRPTGVARPGVAPPAPWAPGRLGAFAVTLEVLIAPKGAAGSTVTVQVMVTDSPGSCRSMAPSRTAPAKAALAVAPVVPASITGTVGDLYR